MKNISTDEKRLLALYLHKVNTLYERKVGWSLSRQAELASDALMISQLLELINDIENKPEAAKRVSPVDIETGIHIIEKLRTGEDYLSQRKTHLMQRPDSADTVGYIKDRTDLQIRESSEIVIATLNAIRNWPSSQSTLDTETLEFTKRFLRAVHIGIMDQLEASAQMPTHLM